MAHAKVQTDSENMTVSVNYPHALHSRHRPERPEGPQGSHCPERLDPSSSKEGGCEVDQRDLRLLVLLVVSLHIPEIVSLVSLRDYSCQCYGVSKAC